MLYIIVKVNVIQNLSGYRIEHANSQTTKRATVYDGSKMIDLEIYKRVNYVNSDS